MGGHICCWIGINQCQYKYSQCTTIVGCFETHAPKLTAVVVHKPKAHCSMRDRLAGCKAWNLRCVRVEHVAHAALDLASAVVVDSWMVTRCDCDRADGGGDGGDGVGNC